MTARKPLDLTGDVATGMKNKLAQSVLDSRKAEGERIGAEMKESLRQALLKDIEARFEAVWAELVKHRPDISADGELRSALRESFLRKPILGQ